MKGYIAKGEKLDCVAPSGGVVSGGVYAINDTLVIAETDADTDGVFVGFVGPGIVEVVKASGAAWAVGEKAYFNSGASNFNNSSGTFVGVVAKDAESAATAGWIRFDGAPRS